MKSPNTLNRFNYQINNPLYPSIPEIEIEPKRKLNKSSSSFFDPGYIEKLIKRRERSNPYNNNIINQNHLNSLLCKLKNYYNEVLGLTQAKQKEIEQIKEDNDLLCFQHKQIIDFQDIDLPDEKISVKNFNTLKVSKEQLETTVRSFVQEKSQLNEVFKNESEYAKTIEYMHQQEKENLKAISDEIAITEEKIQAINVFRRNIDINVFERQKKQKNYALIIEKLNDDMDLIDNVMEDQTKKSTGLDKIITQKEKECAALKNQIQAILKVNNEVVQKEKEEIHNKIAYTNDLIRLKYIKELKFIKTILGLNFIQKYFLSDNESFNTSLALTESKEYKEFTSDKIIIFDENFKVIFETKKDDNKETIKLTTQKKDKARGNSFDKKNNQSQSKHEKSFQQQSSSSASESSVAKHTNNIIKRSSKSITPSYFNSYANKSITRHRASSTSLNKEPRMTLSQLKQRFDDIQITRDDIFQYYYRIIDRIRFYRNDLIKLNDKEIMLENKKDINNKKVKEIIMKDYKNFNDLIRNNSRFQSFMERNEKLIVTSRNMHEMSKMKKINKAFNDTHSNSFIINDSIEQNSITHKKGNRKTKHAILTPHSIEESSIDLFRNAYQLVRETKNFFESIGTIIRRIHATIGDKSNNDEGKKIERFKSRLSSYKQEPFGHYVIQLIDFIASESKLSTLVNSITGVNTLTQLKEEIFINGNINEPNEDFIKRLLSKDMHNQNELFAFLMDKRKAVKAFKYAFDYKINVNVGEESSFTNIGQPMNIPANKEFKESFQPNKSMYLTKMKGSGKSKLIRNKRDTSSNRDDSYSDKDTALSDHKTSKRKNNSVDQKIIKKLYEPVLAKTFYNRKLNNNMSIIKGLTRSNSKANYALLKKRQEVDEMSNSLLIYNNKKINVNELSNSSYNTMVRYVVSNQASKIWKNKEFQ